LLLCHPTPILPGFTGSNERISKRLGRDAEKFSPGGQSERLPIFVDIAH
jgi:hypothetical protein